MEVLVDSVTALNSLTPLAVIGLLSFIVYLLVSKKGPVRKISENHLHDLPTMAATLIRMEVVLEEIRDGITILRERR